MRICTLTGFYDCVLIGLFFVAFQFEKNSYPLCTVLCIPVFFEEVDVQCCKIAILYVAFNGVIQYIYPSYFPELIRKVICSLPVISP